MFFFIAKVVWFVLRPDRLLIIVLMAGALFTATTRFRLLGIRLMTAVAVALAVVTVLPVGPWLARPLEERFARPPLPARVDGVVILAGGDSPALAAAHPTITNSIVTEPLLEGVYLHHLYPKARIIYSSGSGRLNGSNTSEAESGRRLFDFLGGKSYVEYETRSRDTWENIVFTQRLVHPKRGETWLLVTTALHMPRTMAVARGQGWNLLPWPTYYRTAPQNSYLYFLPFYNLDLASDALHEWIGLAAYRINGRSAEFFPG